MMKIKGGYILQPRIIDGSDVSRMPPVAREIWQYLLRNVNYSGNGKLKRGQGFFTRKSISEALCWYVGFRKEKYSEKQITVALRRLSEGQMVDTAKVTHGMVITVCNYELYQNPQNYEGHNEKPPKAPRKASGGHNKLKEGKEEEGKEETYKPDFEAVWKRYPNTDGKKASRSSFAKTVLTEDDFISINKALDCYLDSRKVRDGYIKNASTWFRNWQDWIGWEEPKEKDYTDNPIFRGE